MTNKLKPAMRYPHRPGSPAPSKPIKRKTEPGDQALDLSKEVESDLEEELRLVVEPEENLVAAEGLNGLEV